MNSDSWTIERIEQLAPDSAAVKAAHGVARPAKWTGIGRNATVIWGECQGSGANPYQVRVDLADAAGKCSCPSRKLPCKHTLGLLLLLARGVGFPERDAPGFVAEWVAGREKRAQAAAVKRPAHERVPDPDAQAKRAEKRESRIEAGLDQLDIWLQDIMTEGLAAVRARPPAFWTQMAARLVDAQAPGLARRVEDAGEIAVGSADWAQALLTALARIQLLVDAYQRVDVLPEALAAEVRSATGWTQSQEMLLARDGVRDRWQVVGRRQSERHNLRTEHAWLSGLESRRAALVLEFAAGGQPMPASFAAGQVFEGELVFFDGAPPLRALFKHRKPIGLRQTLPHPSDVAGIQEEFAGLLAVTPWLERWPFVLGPVDILFDGARWLVADSAGRRVPVVSRFRHGWHLLALASERPVTMFGEWDGRAWHPLSIEAGGALLIPGSLGELPVLAPVA